jgi:ADP-ribosyl-[dinitrogen reductase] hydrolase
VSTRTHLRGIRPFSTEFSALSAVVVGCSKCILLPGQLSIRPLRRSSLFLVTKNIAGYRARLASTHCLCKMQPPRSHPILSAIASGDALGLPFEGTIPKAVKWGFLGNWGITSDDTQHAVLAWRALEESGRDLEKFRPLIADCIARWFCCLSPSIGWGTVKASLKLCAGLHAPESGSGSEGNGPLPRAAILGWELFQNPMMDDFVTVSTTTTHNSAKAVWSSLVTARTIALLRSAPNCPRETLFENWFNWIEDPFWRYLLGHAIASKSTGEFLKKTDQRKGVSGHAYYTLLVSLLALSNHRTDIQSAVIEVVSAGGDTDSSAALTAALCSAAGAVTPTEWTKIIDWPQCIDPSISRLGYNFLTLAVILGYHIPKRLFARLLHPPRLPPI